MVAYASQVQIQPNQSGDKLTATVVAIAPGIDLAVLKLDDESFFDTHPPLKRGSGLPGIKDAVLAYGYPTGGSALSITKGIVSRIEFVGYSNWVSGLRVQVDAAVNPGNSGGPAVVDDQMIGLAFSTLNNAQNISYIIPNEEIDMFLADIAGGQYRGKPALYDELQTLENPALRKFLKLGKDVKGILVHRPYRSDAAYPLKEWDLITHVAGTPVDDQGMIEVNPQLRLSLRYQVQKVAKDGVVALTIVRAGKSLQINLPVLHEWPGLLSSLDNGYPPYFVYGPLVFSRATADYAAFMNGNANSLLYYTNIRSPLVTRRTDMKKAEHDELVVISSPFFPHKLAIGYSNPEATVLKTINGKPVRNLAQVVEYLRDLKEDFVTVETDNRGGETMVFEHRAMLASVEEILNDNGVRAQGSPDMMKIWSAKR